MELVLAQLFAQIVGQGMQQSMQPIQPQTPSGYVRYLQTYPVKPTPQQRNAAPTLRAFCSASDNYILIVCGGDTAIEQSREWQAHLVRANNDFYTLGRVEHDVLEQRAKAAVISPEEEQRRMREVENTLRNNY